VFTHSENEEARIKAEEENFVSIALWYPLSKSNSASFPGFLVSSFLLFSHPL
jgi:hypothetical protein